MGLKYNNKREKKWEKKLYGICQMKNIPRSDSRSCFILNRHVRISSCTTLILTLCVTTRSSNASTVWSLARSHPTYSRERYLKKRKIMKVLLSHSWMMEITLYLPRFLTEHVRTASRPAGNVTFCIVPSNSGSTSPWRLLISSENGDKNGKR